MATPNQHPSAIKIAGYLGGKLLESTNPRVVGVGSPILLEVFLERSSKQTGSLSFQDLERMEVVVQTSENLEVKEGLPEYWQHLKKITPMNVRYYTLTPKRAGEEKVGVYVVSDLDEFCHDGEIRTLACEDRSQTLKM